MKSENLMIIDPSLEIPEIESYNNISLCSPLKTTYHLPAIHSPNTMTKNFANANLECDFIGRSYKGRGFSCGFAVIEDLKGFCYIKNNNNEDILIVDWACNTTAGINGDAYCAGKLNIVQGFGRFAGVSGFGEINMPIVKTINSKMSNSLNITLNIKYPMSLKK